MKVKLLVMRVGPGIRDYPGQVIDLPEGEALRLVSAGQAEAVEPETASTAPAESAVKKRGRPKKTE